MAVQALHFTDTLNGSRSEYRPVIHVEQLILDGGTARVNYQYLDHCSSPQGARADFILILETNVH